MRNNFRVLLAIAILALAALSCQAVTSGGNSAPDAPATDVVVENTSAPADTEVPPPTATEPPANDSGVLMEDDFSGGRSQWGTGTDADSAVEYVDEALNIQLFTGNYVVWTYPNEESYENIHMEVTVKNNGTDSDTAFGLFCYKQYPIDDSRYYFAVSPNGDYAIAKAQLALDDEILTNGNTWGKSDLIKPDADSYRIGVDCGNGTLTLYVDGQKIDSVSDSTYTSGSIALFAWSGETVKKVDVSFDDFQMSKLP
jgi:hypothetical protein